MRPAILFFLLPLLSLFSCQKDSSTRQYLYIGHAYQWGAKEDNRVDERLEKLAFDDYDQIWLGGDVCARTTSSPATLTYLDQLFDLKNPDHHWSVGNHDVLQGNLSYITDATGRPTFYSHHKNGLTFFVMNTNLNHPQVPKEGDDCEKMDAQFELFLKLTDTLSASSHFFVLHHHGLLSNSIAENTLDVDSIFHFNRPMLNMTCKSPGNFEEKYYKRLVDIQKRGIQVILVCGDVGQRVKEFEFTTKDGITFLGSGINNSCKKEFAPEWVKSFAPDKLLVFKHDLAKKKLTWEFEELNKMIE